MTFDDLLANVLEILQRQGRVSYGALKRRFALDDAYLEDLKTKSSRHNGWQSMRRGEFWSGRAPPPRPLPPYPRHSQPQRPRH